MKFVFVCRQAVPRLFRSAENIGISSVLIISTAVVCVYVIYVCWQTKNSAEKTGVFLHKLANIVDENHFYETVSRNYWMMFKISYFNQMKQIFIRNFIHL